MSNPAGPGWYGDPDDPLLLRYFDGIMWTAHTTTRRSPTADASQIGHAPEVPPAAAPHPGTQNLATYAPGAGGWTTRSDVLPDGAVLAPWWRRLLARLVDTVTVGIITGILAWPWLGKAFNLFQDFFSQTLKAGSGGPEPDATAFQTQFIEALLPVAVISLTVTVVYEVAFLVWRSATPGKMLFGTIVRRSGAPGGVTLVVALRRQVISVITGLLGFLPLASVIASIVNIIDPAWLLWDPKRQTLHDKVADTVVVMKGP